MPINLEKLPQRLKDAARNGTLVPFIGAGISQQAETSPPAFPTWSQFLGELADLAKEEGRITADEKEQITQLVFRGKFLMAAQAIKSVVNKDVLETYIQTRFSPPDAKPADIHKKIFRLEPSLILTTNYDRLLEDAYASVYQKTCESLTYNHASQVQRFLQSNHSWQDRPVVFKLHGSASFPAETILAELDYRRLVYQESGYRNVLSAIFLTRVVLMLGFSFSDPELSSLIEALRDSLKYGTSPDYIVLPKDEKGSVEKTRLRDDFGLQVIEYEETPGHPELGQLVDYLVSLKEANTTALGTTSPSHERTEV